MPTDAQYMDRALELAAEAVSDAAPNPAVGCVIVNGGQIVGEGWTAPPGGPHAEIVALAAAGERARGADVYVTLEPCCHIGRTGPCTAALIDAGVARVCYAIEDPNPAVAGRGAAALRAAGIETRPGPGAARSRRLNEGFFSRMLRGRPFVRVKIAASVDGRTALHNGTSQWITGAQARADVHRWRARSSAVLTGIATVLADDPQLTARPVDLENEFTQPLRVVLDSQLRCPADARLLQVPNPVLLMTCAHADATREWPAHVSIAAVSADTAGHCELGAVFELLGTQQVNDVWVEAGGTLNGALLAADLVDELVVYTAPCILGADGLPMFAISGFTQLAQRHQFLIDSAEKIGDDLRVVYRPSNVPRSAAST